MMKYKIKQVKNQTPESIIRNTLKRMSDMSKDIFKINMQNLPEFRAYIE
jgi:hypothetical protein